MVKKKFKIVASFAIVKFGPKLPRKGNEAGAGAIICMSILHQCRKLWIENEFSDSSQSAEESVKVLSVLLYVTGCKYA